MTSIDARPRVPGEESEALPVEFDDVVAAGAGHNPAVGPIVTPLFVFAGACAAGSTAFGVRTAYLAHRSVKRIKKQLQSLAAKLSNLEPAPTSASPATAAHRANLEALTRERTRALHQERYKRWSSLVMSLGTGTQTLGIVSSPALLGGLLGIAPISPFLLGGGLLLVGAFASFGVGREVYHHIVSGPKQTRSIKQEVRLYVSQQPLARRAWHKRQRRKHLFNGLGISAEVALGVGCLTMGLSMLGLITLPHVVGLLAVGCIAAGVVGLITTYFARRSLQAFRPVHGLRKEFLGSIESIVRRIEFCERNRRLLNVLRHGKGDVHERLDLYLESEAKLRCTLKPESPHSHDCMLNLRPTSTEHQLYDRTREYLARQGLLAETIDTLLRRKSSLVKRLLQRQDRSHYELDLDDPRLGNNPAQRSDFEMTFLKAALRVIVRKESRYRRDEIRELIDHLEERRYAPEATAACAA